MVEFYRGYKIKIEPDEFNDDPRDWDNLGTMICFHKRYELGDPTPFTADDFAGWIDLANYLKEEVGVVLIFSLYLYDHSSLTIKIGNFYGMLPEGHAEFDSGQVGYIYVTRQDILKAYPSWKHLTAGRLYQVTKVLEAEVDIYNKYLNGEVYLMTITNLSGDHIEDCGGFYDIDDTLAEGRNIIDQDIAGVMAKHIKTVKSYITQGVPAMYRKPCPIKT